jgi:hypothetical protein
MLNGHNAESDEQYELEMTELTARLEAADFDVKAARATWAAAKVRQEHKLDGNDRYLEQKVYDAQAALSWYETLLKAAQRAYNDAFDGKRGRRTAYHREPKTAAQNA